jgi:NitT/TauT family transport system substrate-binding protein
MSCCEKPYAAPDRRTILKGIAGATAVAAATVPRLARAEGPHLKLAFCGQLLCVVPYEVSRERGHFRDEGLNLELVYTRGGSAAMQALVGGAVDYAATAFEVAMQAFARGAKIARFASTGRLPLFALAIAPKNKDTINTPKDLEGKTIGVSALGNADHLLAMYLMSKAGADPKKARFATVGTNLYDTVRLGQVDAGMVQEPALTLLNKAGGKTLVNFMNLDDARRYLGGTYEFMGVSVRAEERDKRLDEMHRLARALAKGLHDTRTLPIEEVVAALPKALVAGGDRAQLVDILGRYRSSLYPEGVKIDLAAAERVDDAMKQSGTLAAPVDLDKLLDRDVIRG